MPQLLKYENLINIYVRVYRRLWRILFASNFKKFGKHSYITFPLELQNTNCIEIGDYVSILKQAWLGANFVDNHTPSLIIDDGARIGNYNHIISVREVYIGKHVMTADKVYISDNLHAYEDITQPIIRQPVYFKGTVHIGDGTLVGECVSIIGARIGKHCVIGANSVVTRDIPDYSVAVGSPARVIKKYDSDKKQWISVPQNH